MTANEQSPPPAQPASASKKLAKAPPKRRKVARIADSPTSDDAEMEQVALPAAAALPALPRIAAEADPQAMAAPVLAEPALPSVVEFPLVALSAGMDVDSQSRADSVETRQPITASPASNAAAPGAARDVSPFSGSDLTDLESDVPSSPKKLSTLLTEPTPPMPSIFASADPSPIAAEHAPDPPAASLPAPSPPAATADSAAPTPAPASQASLFPSSNKATPVPDSVGHLSSLEQRIPSLGQTPVGGIAPSVEATPSGSGATPSLLGKMTGVGKVVSQQATPKSGVAPSLPASPALGRTPTLPKPGTPSVEASLPGPPPPPPAAAAAATSTPKPTAGTSSAAAAKAGLKPSMASKNPLAKMRSSKVGPGGAGTAGQPAKGSGGFNIMSVLSSSGAQVRAACRLRDALVRLSLTSTPAFSPRSRNRLSPKLRKREFRLGILPARHR